MSWTTQAKTTTKLYELQIRCWRYHLRLFRDFIERKNRTLTLKLIFLCKYFALMTQKKLSHHPSIQGALFTSQQKKKEKKKKSSANIVVKLTNVSPFRWWFRTEFFDRSIYTLLFTKMETGDGISQAKEIFRFLKYCSRQIYAKDRMYNIYMKWRYMAYGKMRILYFSINCADKNFCYLGCLGIYDFLWHILNGKCIVSLMCVYVGQRSMWKNLLS